MAEIVVVCPFCHRTVRVPIRFGSRRVRCPECSERGYVADPYHLPDERSAGPLVGESILNCVIEERQAEDTFNVFYRAFDEEAEAPVLVRVPRPEWARERRHLSEALRVEMIAAGIEHPNLLAASRGGEDLRRGIRYAILPMGSHLTLDEHLRTEGPLPPRQVARIGSLLADALASLHDLGVVHLAVCAANVILSDDGAPALKGFEFARFLPGEGSQPILMRYPLHLSPEQKSGGPVDERSDTWSLGETLRYALGGLSAAPGLMRIIHRMVEIDPDARPASCRDVRDALDGLLGIDAPSHERALWSPTRPRRRTKVPWSVAEFAAVQDEIRRILDRPKDDWKIEGWRREEPASRDLFVPATYHRDNQIALVFLKRYKHAPTACGEHLGRYQWIGAFFAGHGADLERRGLIVADHDADTFGVRKTILTWLCSAVLQEGQAWEKSELNAVLRAVDADPDSTEWMAVDSACFPYARRDLDPWDPDY